MIWYILIAIVVAAVWGAGVFLEWPLWIALSVTGVAIVVVGVLVFLRIRKARAARAKGKTKGAPSKTMMGQVVSAEFHGNVAALQTGFEKTITALEASKLGKKTRRPAEALPWYVVVGAPGSGKSTALGSSGVRFPYRSAGDTGASSQDSSGTRSCEFWMSNDAVLLDTSGRYVADDACKPEWAALLKLLLKHRPRRPLNGIVVAVSLDELRVTDDEALFAQARQIRARIDEAIERLHMMLPVYVVVTKCDLLTGFIELFGDLDDSEVGSAWGFTNSRRNSGAGAATFAPYFDELLDLARRRALVRLEHERDPAVAARAYAFPEQLERMRTRLSAFVGEVFSENIYREMPLFRGLYLTSARQDGLPFDAVLEPCARALGISPVPDPGRHGLRPRGYFLRDVFERVVFRDRFLAHDTAGHAKRMARFRYAGAGLGLAAAVGLTYASVRSYGENDTLLGELGSTIEGVEPHVKGSADGTTVPMNVVERLHGAERRLAGYDSDGVPWRMRWGMYRGDSVLPSLRHVYGKVLRQALLGDLVARDERLLREFTTRFAGNETSPNDEDYGHHHAILRRYLLVTSPAEAGEPGLDETQREWLQAQLLSHWQGAASEPLPESADEIVSAYLDMVAADPSLTFPRDTKLVGGVRSILRRSDRTTTILVQIIDDVERLEPSLSLRDMCNSRAITNGDRKVRAAFTRRAWENHVKPMLDEPLEELVRDEWVVGSSDGAGSSRAADDMAKLRSRYFERYIDEWDQFLDPLQVASPNEALEALTILQDLVRGSTPPLASLMQHVAYNTRLTQVAKNEAEKLQAALDAAKEKAGELAAKKTKGRVNLPPSTGSTRDGMASEIDVEKRFEPFVSFGAAPPVEAPADGAPPPPPQSVQLDVYTEQLVALRDAVQQQLDNPQDRDTLPTRLKQAHMAVKGLIADRELGWHQRFSAILEPPILGLQQLSRGSVIGDLAQAWCNDVVTPFERTLASKYPFARSSRYDASLAEFVDYYRPDDGKLWGFYQAALTSIVTTEGDGFRLLEQGASSKTNYNSAVLAFLQRSQDIGRAMFPSGSKTPLVVWEVDIQPTPGVSVTEFTVDGVTIDYRNGPPRPQTMSWPGEGDKRGASLRARGRGINGHVEQDGDWGFLRLLEQGEVIGNAGQQVFTVRWDLTDQNAGVIAVKFRPKRGPTPFFGVHERPTRFLGVFRDKAVAAPRQLVLERAPCRVSGSDG